MHCTLFVTCVHLNVQQTSRTRTSRRRLHDPVLEKSFTQLPPSHSATFFFVCHVRVKSTSRQSLKTRFVVSRHWESTAATTAVSYLTNLIPNMDDKKCISKLVNHPTRRNTSGDHRRRVVCMTAPHQFMDLTCKSEVRVQALLHEIFLRCGLLRAWKMCS